MLNDDSLSNAMRGSILPAPSEGDIDLDDEDIDDDTAISPMRNLNSIGHIGSIYHNRTEKMSNRTS